MAIKRSQQLDRTNFVLDKLNVKNVLSADTVNIATNATFAKVTGNGAFRGIATVLSGDSSITVSATNINSGFPIVVTGTTNNASARSIIWSTNSVVDGISMAIVGDKATTLSVEVHWITIT